MVGGSKPCLLCPWGLLVFQQSIDACVHENVDNYERVVHSWESLEFKH
jgi:hypothetical protein